ncbi:hypothetical protein RhiirA1_238780 [Rhizophagus irregularis]|uniref:Zinc-ribbon domain-containing protein n=1 Tax=Rhizophagus irregularis TaxID=588596 RepID=A0A2N0RJH6_9GLOM|nr:hypothetical protein RhiirA1_238780 [Rhizophagus irregularis]
MPKKLTLDMARKIAKKHDGECLSTEYINSKTPMLWKCHQGHIWSIPFNNIKNQKTWCPTCHSPRKTIDDMRQHARTRKGDCLSDKYYNRDTKLKWICEKSHIWEARSEDVLRGTWCPVCAEYINNCSKLLWKCIEGHLWSAPLFSIKNLGNWCPYCAGNARLTLEDMYFSTKKRRWLPFR